MRIKILPLISVYYSGLKHLRHIIVGRLERRTDGEIIIGSGAKRVMRVKVNNQFKGYHMERFGR